MHARRLGALLATTWLAACGGGGGGGAQPAAPAQDHLTTAEVERIVAQAVAEARARSLAAHVAVVDRSGNVLAAYTMPGAPAAISVLSGLPAPGGLETPEPVVPAVLAAIAKAITGAYLSSHGNAFTTRTAGQIVQEHFNPNEAQQPSGPLYGVQFSQLTCSDVTRKPIHGSAGPKRSPLGLAGDPGGIPLYKGGVLVGGIGIEADGLYGIDRDLRDVDEAAEERVAVAGSTGFAAPADIRGDRITADGRTLRFVDSESLASDPARAPAPPAAGYRPVEGYFDGAPRAGVAYGSAASGLRAQAGAADGRWIVTDASGNDRFAPRAAAGGGALSQAEVDALLAEALAVARRARAQIRRPLGSAAEVTIAVVGIEGEILGLVRTPDGPVFGIDVAVQKARTAMFFSHPDAPAELAAAPEARFLNGAGSDIARYVDRMSAFAGVGALGGAVAWSARAVGNMHRPFFPDGIEGTPEGPLSTPIATWSPFNVGLQLDLVNNQLVKGVLGDLGEGCAGRVPQGVPEDPLAPTTQIAKVRNGLQVFPGGVPIYRGGALVGGIGVSGDGVDQDDMIAFLGVHQAGVRTASGLGNAPAGRRADRLTPQGTRLRYVQCPQAPFVGSETQDACAGK